MKPRNAKEYFTKHTSHAPESNAVSQSKLRTSNVYRLHTMHHYPYTCTIV